MPASSTSQPKEERLISYAIDLGTEVEADCQDTSPDRITKVKINKGIVYQTTRGAARRRPTTSRTAPSTIASC